MGASTICKSLRTIIYILYYVNNNFPKEYNVMKAFVHRVAYFLFLSSLIFLVLLPALSVFIERIEAKFTS